MCLAKCLYGHICLLGQMFFWPNFVWSNVHMVNLFGYILHGQMFLGSNWVKETSNQPCFRLTGFLLNIFVCNLFLAQHMVIPKSHLVCVLERYILHMYKCVVQDTFGQNFIQIQVNTFALWILFRLRSERAVVVISCWSKQITKHIFTRIVFGFSRISTNIIWGEGTLGTCTFAWDEAETSVSNE